MYFLPFLLLYRLQRFAIDARRKNRTWHYLAWSTVSALSACVLFALITAFVWLCFYVGIWWLGVVMIVFALMPVVGTILVRRVFVPLGAFRLAYVAGYVSRPGKDPAAYAMCVAAWALARGHSGAGEAWIAVRRNARMPLGDAEVVTTALLAAGRGDIETARLLMRSVQMLAEDHPPVRELAGEWLACDAAERGAWQELADDAAAARWPATPMTYFLEGVAARRTRAVAAPTAVDLQLRWILAPYRRVTRALLDDALRAQPEPEAAPPPAESEVDLETVAPPERAQLPRAIAAHLVFGHRRATPIALGAAVRAWDTALTDGATHGWLARRALELDAPLGAVDRALREVTAVVTDDLARIADAARLGAPPSHGPIGDALSRRLRHGRLDALEAGFNAWVARRDEFTHRQQLSSARPPIDEWREFIALQTAYTAAVTAGGLELRRLAFPHAFTTGSNMAAWLWNAFGEYSMSHAIFRWLRDEALAVGDTEAIDLGNRNCNLRVPTRMDDDFTPSLGRT